MAKKKKKSDTKKTDTTKKPKDTEVKVKTPRKSEAGVSIYDLVNEDNTKKICGNNNSGFYYDSQLNDPFLSITLHANTVETNGVWDFYKGEKVLEAINNEVEGSKHYMAEPLAKCILTEDLAYSVQNNFTDNNMGNPIESMFETFKPYAPVLGKMADGITKGAGDAAKSNNFGSAIASTLGNWGKAIAPWMKSAEGYLNKALMVQGTRFTYYNGTSFNFNNLEMKFTVFSDWDYKGNFYSVEDYIKKLTPYVMGKYYPSTNYEPISGVNSEDLKKFLADYVGFQEPPGGFKMDTQNLNNVLRGTLRLNIGGMWAIDNLVIKNMNVVLSKVQAKDPRGMKYESDKLVSYDGSLVPLYAEITLQLAPACIIVDEGYSRITNHNGLKDIRSAAANAYMQKLNKLRSDLSSDLN